MGSAWVGLVGLTHHLLLGGAHGVPEVLIEAQCVGVLDGESLELIIVPHLVGGSHLVGSNGNGLAVDLDGSDGVDESVELQEILWRWPGLDAGLRDEWVVNLLLLVLLWWGSVLLDFLLLGLDEDLVRLSHEHPTEFVDVVLIFGLYLGELGEVEVSTAAPEEGLRRELVASLKIQALGNIVILLDALDFAPE